MASPLALLAILLAGAAFGVVQGFNSVTLAIQSGPNEGQVRGLRVDKDGIRKMKRREGVKALEKEKERCVTQFWCRGVQGMRPVPSIPRP